LDGKDRIAKYIVEQGETEGLLKPGYAIIVDVSLIDEVVAVKSHDAFRIARRLSRERALFVGI
jgi:cysteine synthase